MKYLFDDFSRRVSKMLTKKYSTSFSLGIMCLGENIRSHVYAIYGYVRLADEIVDSFHGFDKEDLLTRLEAETWKSLEEKISLNPILQSFQETVNTYNIDRDLIKQFLWSMKMDLEKIEYNESLYKTYIYGSAEVVGLMCLKIFVQGDEKMYHELKPYALKLGSAFQKVNFLRDLKADFATLGRTYFPHLQSGTLDDATKVAIEQEISGEFEYALTGILRLPVSSRFGVFLAYRYYVALFRRIVRSKPSSVMNARIRINNFEKFLIFMRSNVKYRILFSR